MDLGARASILTLVNGAAPENVFARLAGELPQRRLIAGKLCRYYPNIVIENIQILRHLDWLST